MKKQLINIGMVTSSMLLLTGCGSVVNNLEKEDMNNSKVLEGKEFSKLINDGYSNTTYEVEDFTKYNIKLENNDNLENLPDVKVSMNVNQVNISEFIEELSNIVNISIMTDFRSQENYFENGIDRNSNLVQKEESIVENSLDTLNNILKDDTKKQEQGEQQLVEQKKQIVQNTPSVPSFNKSKKLDKQTINLNVKEVPLKTLLRAIEKNQNLDFSYDSKNNILYVKDYMMIEGSFSNLDSKIDIYSKLKTNLEIILKDQSKKVVIESLTGAFYISSTPNDLRESKEMIEQTINNSNLNALVEVKIYKINNSKLKEFGLNTDILVKNIYKLSLGQTTVSNPLFAATKTIQEGSTEKIDFSFGLKMLEQKNIINSETSPVVSVFNGLDTALENPQETGQWIPGESKEVKTVVNGVIETNYTESKPTFESIKVGTFLKILKPKINLNEKSIFMDFNYKESKVYDFMPIVWNRNKDSQVTLNKPLISESIIEERVVLTEGKYSVISGTKHKASTISNNNIPGTSGTPLSAIGADKEDNSINDILVIAKPYLPKNVKNVYITKHLDYTNSNEDEDESNLDKYTSTKNQVSNSVKPLDTDKVNLNTTSYVQNQIGLNNTPNYKLDRERVDPSTIGANVRIYEDKDNYSCLDYSNNFCFKKIYK